MRPDSLQGASKNFVYVSDREGNEFICPVGELIDPNEASQEQLANCFDSAMVGRNPKMKGAS